MLSAPVDWSGTSRARHGRLNCSMQGAAMRQKGAGSLLLAKEELSSSLPRASRQLRMKPKSIALRATPYGVMPRPPARTLS